MVSSVAPGRTIILTPICMEQYLALLDDVLTHGVRREDRTGTGTLSVFGRQARFNLLEGFPCLTTKKLHIRSIIYELLWFLSGGTNVRYLQENGVTIWDEWAGVDGELGPIYGHQWRRWSDEHGGSIDQIAVLIDGLKNDPWGRRHIVSAWNVAQLGQMAIPPCHCLFQFYVLRASEPYSRNRLSLQLYQRSCDLFLGVPFNIASYALLLMMVAQVCNYEAYEFIHTYGDLHIYLNHIDQARLQLTRHPRTLPTMHLNPAVKDIDAFQYEDFTLENYHPYPHIQANISV